MSIKAKFAKSGFWMALSAGVNNLSSVLVFIALARLLTPEQFGIVAFATIFVDLGRIVVVGGLSETLVQRRDWEESLSSSAFWLNVTMSVFLCLIIAGVAAPISYVYYDRTFALVLAALSLILFLEGLTTVHTAKLMREFRYKAIAARNSVIYLLTGILGVILAWMGWGVWALVVSRLVAVMVAGALIWTTTGWTPKAIFRKRDVGILAPTASHLLGNHLLTQTSPQIVGLMIGAFISPAAVAQYRVGTRVLNLLTSIIIIPLQSAALSAFSRLRDRGQAIAPAYVRVARTASLISCPIFLGSAAIAPDFVHIVFGTQWDQAGYIMTANAFIVGPALVMYFFNAAMTSSGKSALVLKSAAASWAANLMMTVVTIPFGVVKVAWGQSVRPHLTLPFSLWLLNRGIGLKPSELLRAILPAWLSALAMVGILYLMGRTVLSDMTPIERMSIMIAAGGPLYLLGLLLIGRDTLREGWKELGPLLKKPRSTE